jgi:hypothetical protein
MQPYKLVQPYKKYFQKSRSFLYPALRIKRGAAISPYQTYISYGDKILPEHRKLLVLYRDFTYPFQIFQKEVLRTNPMYSSSFLLNDDAVVYVFDFDAMKDDWDWFLQGRYSNLSPELKKRIRTFFGPASNEYAYMDSFLYPERYFSYYSQWFSVDRSILEQTGELTDGFDEKKEDLR